MDGIAGIVYSDVFQMTNLLTPMLGSLTHRCRKIQDVCTIKNVQLGGCGHQVVANPQKTIYAALDGTIYNADDLKKELIQLGYSFCTEVTSEVLARAFEEWGVNFFSRLQGDFAFAIYDQRNEKLFLVRDRIGKKPLYWYHDQHHFIFASELKAILATGAVSQTVARDGIAAYFYFGYIPQDMSPVKDVNKLLPAHYLEFELSGSKQIQPYWSYSSYFGHKKKSEKSVMETLDQLLRESVELRIPQAQKHHEPIGCFLSGGLGSASIAYYIKNLARNHPQMAFSVGFEGENEEDIRAAQEVAQTLQIPHQFEMITPDHFLDHLVQVIWHLDEPVADPNIIATWQITKLASMQTHSVFSGMGSDELLAGHTRYKSSEKQRSLLNYFKPLFQHLLMPILKFIYKPAAFTILKETMTNPMQFDFVRKNALFDERLISIAAPNLYGLFDPEVFLHKFQNLYQFKSSIASYLYLDVKTRLVDCFILQYERFTTAHSLDWYTPFLDRIVIEYLATLYDPEVLIDSSTADQFKKILKTVFPEKFVNRPKVNRPNFLNRWTPTFRNVFQSLQKGMLVENGIISEEWIHNALLSPKVPFRILFSILVLEIWYRLFINQSIVPIPPELSVQDYLNER